MRKGRKLKRVAPTWVQLSMEEKNKTGEEAPFYTCASKRKSEGGKTESREYAVFPNRERETDGDMKEGGRVLRKKAECSKL